MTELERRALLGDRQAQEECTEKGIVLACPWCGCDERDMFGLNVYHEQYFYSCEACGCNGPVVFDNDTCDYPEHEALVKWNTRPAPPVGRCGECEKSPDIGTKTKGMRWCRRFRTEVKLDGYCDGFKPKEGEENAAG